MDENLHSPQRRRIDVRIEHADFDPSIDSGLLHRPGAWLALRRLERLPLRCGQSAGLKIARVPAQPARGRP